MEKATLCSEVVIPAYAEEAVFVQSVLLECTAENISETVKTLAINYSEPTPEDMDRIASEVFTIVKSRPKDQKTYATLMAAFQLYTDRKFNVDTLLSAPPWFLRHLYLAGLVDIKKIKERCQERPFYRPFFIPEFQYGREVLRNEFREYNNSFEELSKNDYQKFKEILEFGYTKDSFEYAIKYDDIEAAKKFPTKNVSMSPVELMIFQENSFRQRMRDVWDENKKNIMPVVFAAHYGSEKCFDYFLGNSIPNIQVINEACFGGNRHIVDKCTNKSVNIGKGVIAAIISFRNDIYDSIVNMNHAEYPYNLSAHAGNVMVILSELNGKTSYNDRGVTRLMTAAERGNYGAVEVLYHKGFPLTESDEYGTCLPRAVSCGHIAIVRQLLNYGASHNDGNNNTRIRMFAEENNQNAIMDILEKKGITFNRNRNVPVTAQLRPKSMKPPVPLTGGIKY